MELSHNIKKAFLSFTASIYSRPALAALDLSPGTDLVTDIVAFLVGPFAIGVATIALAFAAYKGLFARDRELPIWSLATAIFFFIIIRNAEDILESVG